MKTPQQLEMLIDLHKWWGQNWLWKKLVGILLTTYFLSESVETRPFQYKERNWVTQVDVLFFSEVSPFPTLYPHLNTHDPSSPCIFFFIFPHFSNLKRSVCVREREKDRELCDGQHLSSVTWVRVEMWRHIFRTKPRMQQASVLVLYLRGLREV